MDELLKDNDNQYYFTKQARINLQLQIIKNESREELEKEVLRYYLQIEKAKEYLYKKNILEQKEIEELWGILSFIDSKGDK